MGGRGPRSPNGPNGLLRGSECADGAHQPTRIIAYLSAGGAAGSCEARRLRCPPLKSGAPNFCSFRAAERA
eukprot:14163650-Alexandrium_andersonii.AAC.1